MDSIDPQVHIVRGGEVPVLEVFRLVLHWAVKRVTADADNPAPVPRNCSNAGAKSLVESPCRYNNGSISAICGDIRTHAGKIFDEYRCRAPVSGSILLSLTRGAVTEIAPEEVTTLRSR